MIDLFRRRRNLSLILARTTDTLRRCLGHCFGFVVAVVVAGRIAVFLRVVFACL